MDPHRSEEDCGGQSDRDFLKTFAEDGDASIAPPQNPTVHDQVVGRLFEAGESTISVTLAVDAGPGCGGIAWPAGEILSQYLTRRGSAAMRGKTCLELGSGTGLVGIVAAKLGAREVYITDQAPLLPLMHANVRLNDIARAVEVVELNWGEPLPQLPKLDLVLAADCVYFEPAFPLLCRSLRELHDANPSAEFLFCYKKRRKADKRFFSLLKKDFSWKEVEDDPDRPHYAKASISLLRLQRERRPA